MNESFFENVANLIEQARKHVGRTADLTMCITYFEIGRMIVEEEQGGKSRAEYGKGVMRGLADFLTERFGRGYSLSTLKNAKQFYNTYSPSISQTMFSLSEDNQKPQKSQTMFSFSQRDNAARNGAMFNQSSPFVLSWSHYLVLMRIKNEDERRFYEIEAAKDHWTHEQLKREYGSSLYERLALSRDKDKVMRLSREGQVIETPRDILKNPLVLEFYGLEEKPDYSEDDLESAIITNIQKFMLELGKGFLYEARQKRFTFNEKHYRVDLVLYNRLLRCYVLIDLKRDEVVHQDIGQMQMYVHYYDRYVITEGENPTVGILLCKEKDDALVELTLPEGENIYASEYSLYLPDKALLQSKLAEWIEEFEHNKALHESECE